MAPDNTQQQWGRIFITIAAVVVAATMVFNFTVEVDPRPWTIISSPKTRPKVSALSIPPAATQENARGMISGINPSTTTVSIMEEEKSAKKNSTEAEINHKEKVLFS